MLLGDSISNWGLTGGSSDDNLLFEGINDWGVTHTLITLTCDLNKEIKKGDWSKDNHPSRLDVSSPILYIN